jgi:hypothetical protein
MVLFTVFTVVFIAEPGDKTQLANLLFAADKEVSKLTVVVGASLAPVVASGIGVFAGSFISQFIKDHGTTHPTLRSSFNQVSIKLKETQPSQHFLAILHRYRYSIVNKQDTRR